MKRSLHRDVCTFITCVRWGDRRDLLRPRILFYSAHVARITFSLTMYARPAKLGLSPGALLSALTTITRDPMKVPQKHLLRSLTRNSNDSPSSSRLLLHVPAGAVHQRQWWAVSRTLGPREGYGTPRLPRIPRRAHRPLRRRDPTNGQDGMHPLESPPQPPLLPDSPNVRATYPASSRFPQSGELAVTASVVGGSVPFSQIRTSAGFKESGTH